MRFPVTFIGTSTRACINFQHLSLPYASGIPVPVPKLRYVHTKLLRNFRHGIAAFYAIVYPLMLRGFGSWSRSRGRFCGNRRGSSVSTVRLDRKHLAFFDAMLPDVIPLFKR